MRHFNITQWADFVNRTVPIEQLKEMEDHLNTCSECASIEGILARVAASARIEPDFEVPDSLVRRAVEISAVKPIGPRAASVTCVPSRELLAAAGQMVSPPLVPGPFDVGARHARGGPVLQSHRRMPRKSVVL